MNLGPWFQIFRQRTTMQATPAAVSNQSNLKLLWGFFSNQDKMKFFNIVIYDEPIWYPSNLSLMMAVKNVTRELLVISRIRICRIVIVSQVNYSYKNKLQRFGSYKESKM